MSLRAKIHQVFSSLKGFNPSSKLIVGVSGGADSMALMSLLAGLEVPQTIAHFDHSLRPNSKRDARFVEQEAAKLGLHYVSQRVDVARFAKENAKNLEEAARQLRYQFFFEVAEEHQADMVAVGHQADDQVETMLMHLIRGAGVAGLTGMPVVQLPNPWSETIALIRPLLDVSRKELELWCQDNEVLFHEDKSNRDTAFFRNAMRHDVIPSLEAYNPRFKQALLRSQQINSEEDQFLGDLTLEIWARCLVERRVGLLVFDRVHWRQQPLALQRRLLRVAFEAINAGSSRLNLATVENLLHWLRGARRNDSLAWLAGILVLVEGDKLIFQRQGYAEVFGPQTDLDLAIQAKNLQTIDLGDGWEFTLEAVSSAVPDGIHRALERDSYRIICDLGQMQDLRLRSRLPGDRFQPLGMQTGSMKLSDFMINEKLPSRARARWPILAAGQNILWVPGFQQAETVRVRPNSLKLHQLSISTAGP